MPITKKKLTHDRREITVEWWGETCKIGYNRLAANPKLFRLMRDLQRKSETTDDENEWAEVEVAAKAAYVQLETLILDWEVLDEKNRPVPVRQDVLEELDHEFLAAVLQKIWEDFSPPVERSKVYGSIS